jgi:3-hydroxyacyl-[acyl-carrier-protein] dehydratase
MRWFWIDRFEVFDRGKEAVAIKLVTLAEEHLHDHFPGVALMPNSLVLEGMAQTAGLLIADMISFGMQVVLLKVAAADFRFEARPGDCLRYRARPEHVGESGSIVRVTSSVGDQVQAEAELAFAHVQAGSGLPWLFREEEMLVWLDNTRIYHVARDENGVRITRRSGPGSSR